MNKKIKITRVLLALLLALSALWISTSVALADQPAKYPFAWTASGEITDVCPFSIHVEAALSGTEIAFFDKSGGLLRLFDSVTEQDVFSANGKSLTSVPYKYSAEWLFDSSGNLVHLYVSGVAVKVPLPDGSLFITSGRSDFMAHPGATFIMIPDKGTAVNLDGFCAALAP